MRSQHKICINNGPQLTDEKQKGFPLKIRNMPWETNLHVVVCFIAVSGTEPSISLIYACIEIFCFFNKLKLYGNTVLFRKHVYLASFFHSICSLCVCHIFNSHDVLNFPFIVIFVVLICD